jgi:hypothetical protein
MTELLEMAVERIRQLSPERQDEAARVLLHIAGDDEAVYVLTPEEEASFDKALDDVEAGRVLTSQEAHAIWSKRPA